MSTTVNSRGSVGGLVASLSWPVLLVLAPLLTGTPQHYAWATAGVIWGLWSLSLNIVWGYAGQLSLAQLALGGVAAYTTAILTADRGWGLAASIATGTAFAVVLSVVLGAASMRLRGFYFTILSVCFASVVTTVIVNWDTAGRTAGLLIDRSELPVLDVLGVHWTMASNRGGFFALTAVIFVIFHALAVLVRRSATGRAMLAVRDNEALALSVGIRASHIKILAFALSAVVASLAGVLHVYSFRLIVPEFFSFHEALLSLLLIVIGGLGSTHGPAIGALIYVALYQWAPVDGEWRVGLLGVVVIVFVLFFRDGVAGGIEMLSRRLRSTWRRTPESVAHPEVAAYAD